MTTIRFPIRKVPTPAAGRTPPGLRLPWWLRRRHTPRPATVAPGPGDIRWWVGTVVLTASVLALSFVGHVALFGALQETRSQAVLYDQLRSQLANGTAPLGPTRADDTVVPVGSPIALMTIPALQFSQVIVQGSGPDQLRAGPGHRRDTVMPGQVGTSIVLGRQTAYGGPFRDLGRLQPGDAIRIVTGQGPSTFVVTGRRVPGDKLPTAPAANEARLTLVSASGFALAPNSVVYVDAKRVTAGLPAASPIIATAALDAGENVMQTNPNALLPFLFALQWLAIVSGLALFLVRKWGRWQVWVTAVPVLVMFGALTADAAIGFLPNLT